MDTDKKLLIGSCEDHLEPAIDDYVDEAESAPDIVRVEDYTEEAGEIPNHCAFCEKPVRFLVF